MVDEILSYRDAMLKTIYFVTDNHHLSLEVNPKLYETFARMIMVTNACSEFFESGKESN